MKQTELCVGSLTDENHQTDPLTINIQSKDKRVLLVQWQI